MKNLKLNVHMRFIIPAVLTALLVLDGLLGYVAPDPFAGIETVTQTALAAEPPALELEEANAERAASPKGTAGKLSSVNENVDYNDGVYTGTANGFGGKITVSVTIKNGKITSIKIISAPGETKSYLNKASILTGRIVKTQSTNVDAVSGATYSSNGIIKAVRNALAKAAKDKTKKKTTDDDTDTPVQENREAEKPDAISGGKWKDGTYTGEGEGFSGKLHVTVTIEDGKITGLELADSKDDIAYMGKASPSIFDAVLKSQSTDVDAVTGATFSSYGLIQAINDALTKAAATASDSDDSGGSGTDPGTDDPDKIYKDGTYTSTVACTREGWFDYDIIVTLTVEDGRLHSLSVAKGEDFTGDEDDEADNDYYLSRAANGPNGSNGMISRILSSQSADVDTVTGATFSSRSIKSAVSGILANIETEIETKAETEAAKVQMSEVDLEDNAEELTEESENTEEREEAATEETQSAGEVNVSEPDDNGSSSKEAPENDSSEGSGKSDGKSVPDESAVIPDPEDSGADS